MWSLKLFFDWRMFGVSILFFLLDAFYRIFVTVHFLSGACFFWASCGTASIIDDLTWVYLQASNMRIAVAVIFPGDLRQHPVTPVQNEANIDTKAMMKSAIMDLPISKQTHTFIKTLNKIHNIFWYDGNGFNREILNDTYIIIHINIHGDYPCR